MELLKSEKMRPFLASFCALGWSMAYPLIKMGYWELGIESGDLGSKILFAGIRFFVAGLLVLIAAAFRKKNIKISSGSGGMLIAFALVNTTFHYLFSYIGLSYIPSSRSTILDSMGGFMLIILSGLFFADDAFNRKKLAGCVLGISGIIILNIAPAETLLTGISFMGDGMILLNACCAAGGGILTRFISKKMDMMTATGYGMGIGGLVLMVAGVGVGLQHTWNLSAKGMLIIVLLILISAICFGVYNTLLAYHPISKVAIYNAFIPVFGVVFSSLLLEEPFLWQYMAAGFLVAAGIYVMNHNKS
ncbi:MAG: DMT family transporter [Lachnospiraceae bacterium]